MTIDQTPLKDLLLVKPDVHADARGYFFESYSDRTFGEAGLHFKWVQDNESLSQRGVLRGLHYQVEPMAQAKLVRVIAGEAYDVAVDIRKTSPTFGRWFGAVLSEANKLQMLIPRGFAHGFVVLRDNTVFSYKCDNFYSKEHERGIIWNDPDLAIDWTLGASDVQLSEKDRGLATFAQAVTF
jgi:dTDP-4-dehydrorhamnose 3,5-epimerase